VVISVATTSAPMTATFGGTQYLVGWWQTTNPYGIHAARILSNGTVVDSPSLLVGVPSAGFVNEPAYSWDGQLFQALWTEYTSTASKALYGRSLTPQGAFTGPQRLLIPRSAELVMRQDGLGDAAFGVNPEEVIDYISSIAGAPTSDSGWADPFSAFGVCPGTEVRGVTWGDLLVLFSDESTVATGRRHFFSYSYGPPFTDTPRPAAMRTPEGITVGSTVAELRAAYPEVAVTPADDIFARGD
jgi:hypothetical protein